MNRFSIAFLSVFVFALAACSGGRTSKQLEELKAYVAANQAQESTDTIIALLRKDPASKEAPDLALLLASVFEDKWKDTLAATSVYQAIVKAYPGSGAAKEVAPRIPPNALPLGERIEALQAAVFDPQKMMVDTKAVQSYLNSCIAHALLLPQDDKSKVLLHKAAENAYYTQQYDRALYLFQWFENAYPDHPLAAQALFMRAFIHDNDLKQFELAGPLYQEFLRKYPKDDFADDAEFQLEHLGETPEEMMKALEQQQK